LRTAAPLILLAFYTPSVLNRSKFRLPCSRGAFLHFGHRHRRPTVQQERRNSATANFLLPRTWITSPQLSQATSQILSPFTFNIVPNSFPLFSLDFIKRKGV
jgi:hypothetical protein